MRRAAHGRPARSSRVCVTASLSTRAGSVDAAPVRAPRSARSARNGTRAAYLSSLLTCSAEIPSQRERVKRRSMYADLFSMSRSRWMAGRGPPAAKARPAKAS